MTDLSSDDGAIRRILLATDLSARCDRALDRAVALATERRARLTILHVFEEFLESNLTYGRVPEPSWRSPPDAVAIAKARIRAMLRADLEGAVESAAVRIEEGDDPAQVIEQVAAAERIELIVTGIAREGFFASRPVVLGRTVEKLLRRVAVPILIVRNRPRASYGHILVTTDFSEASAQALQVAMRLFPDQKLHLLHAFDVPYVGTGSELAVQPDSFRGALESQLASFLDSMVLPAEARQQLVTFVEPGEPAHLVRDYVRDRGADLVVLGTHGRNAVMEALLGSTAKSILSSLPCDALVIRAPLRRPPP